MITVESASKRYGERTVVDNVSLSVSEGDCLGIVGKNGSGKTTLINMMLKLVKPTGGRIVYDFDERERNRLFGVQMQDGYFEGLLKLKELCSLFCEIYSLPYSHACELMETLELTDRQNTLLSKLSGGERQKVNILLAVLHDPRLLFFDELTTGLDALSRASLYRVLGELRKQGRGIVLVSHYFEEVWNLTDSLLVLADGKSLYQGPKEGLGATRESFERAVLALLEGGRP